ncbi:MAG: hypothetical protein U0905_01920 [Pirellulales bacterium]
MAFFELEDNMDLAERYLKRMLRDVLGDCHEDMEFFDKWVQNGLLDSLKLVLEKPFAHLSYTEAINILKTPDKLSNIQWIGAPTFKQNMSVTLPNNM